MLLSKYHARVFSPSFFPTATCRLGAIDLAKSRAARRIIFSTKDRARGARDMLYPRFGRAIKFRGIKVKHEISRVARPVVGGRARTQAAATGARMYPLLHAARRFLEEIRFPVFHLQTGIHGRTSHGGAALKGCWDEEQAGGGGDGKRLARSLFSGS